MALPRLSGDLSLHVWIGTLSIRAMRFPNACLFCLCLSFSFAAAAQGNPSTPPAPPAGPGAAPGASGPAAPRAAAPTPPAPNAALPNAAPANPAVPNPAMPEVNDAMLTPVELPPQVLSNWQQALELVRSRSTSVAQARAQVALAQAQSRQALVQVLPNLGANAGVTRNLLFARRPDGLRVPEATEWAASVTLQQSLVDLQAWHDIGTSRVREQAAAVSAEDAERIALRDLANTIVNVITAERVAEVNRVSLRSNLSTLDLTKKRTLLGAASAVDVLRAEQEVASSRAQLVAGDEALRVARESLGLALGFPEAWGVTPDIKVDQLAADARSACTTVQSADQRSDVRSARMNLEASERDVSSPSYGRAPTLGLQSSLQYNSPDRGLRPVTWSIGAVLSVPIYDGGALGALRSVNEANMEQSRQNLTQVERLARLEATQAQRAVQVAQATFEVSRQARDIAAESARLSRIAFVHGTGTSFDLVESARRQREAEIDVTIKEFDIVRAQIAALLALSNCNI